jgi:hypothetical protein
MEHAASAVTSLPAGVLGPRLASNVVRMAREGAGIRLDYSPSSLALLDRVVDSIHREGLALEAVTPTLVSFGSYAGEVLVRGGRARWEEFDAGRRDIFGQPFGIITPDGRVWNPLDKAVKRFRHGPQDSLRLFYLSVVGQAQV